MQDRYVGDIGDYVKLAILRALMPGSRLGVIWWRYPDEIHNKDGRHTAYLDNPRKWAGLDHPLFEHLKWIKDGQRRAIEALEDPRLLPGAVFYGREISTQGPPQVRSNARVRWFREALRTVGDCDLVFLDPDNGLESKNFDPGASKSGKSVSLKELLDLKSAGRTIVVYHHQTRMKGGHQREIDYWGQRLGDVGFEHVDALRAQPYSPRAFFLLDAKDEMRSRAEHLALRWGKRMSWHPHLNWPA